MTPRPRVLSRIPLAPCLLLALPVAPAAAQAPAPTAEQAQPLPKIRGFASVSRLIYREAPERPHQLAATFVLPDRARLWLGAGEGSSAERLLLYRSGERCFTIGAGTSASTELAGAERETLLRQLELRRAWMLWPDGADWTGEGELRRADLGALGSLAARLGGDGLPLYLASCDAAGVELERYQGLTWRMQGRRRFPASATLCYQGTPVWSEEVQSVETRVRYLDWFFLPPDRRPSGPVAASLAQLGRPEHVDLPARVVRRRTLAPETFQGGGWPAVIAAGEAFLRETRTELAGQGLKASDQLAFELDAQGVPSACLLRLGDPPPSLPEGWESQGATPAISLALARPEEATPATLRALASLLPEGSQAGAAYLKTGLDLSGGGRGVQLILPVLGN